MSKIITAVFSSGQFVTTAKAFQWDSGDRLVFEGLDLPESYEVHFANSTSEEAIVVQGGANGVLIPDEMFESGSEIYAWVVFTDSDGYYTEKQAKIPVHRRGIPEDLIPTPGDVPRRAESKIKQAVDAWLAEHQPEIGGGIPYAVKDALITLFERVAYTDDQGQTYLNNLKRAFALVKSLVSIEAVLDIGGAEITDSDTLGTLRQYLTVTATYDDGSTAIVTDYTLSGALEIGTSTIVVTYGSASDTVEVEVTGTKTLVSIGAVFDDSETIYDTDDLTLEDLRQYLTVTAYYDDSSSKEVINYTLSGELEVGQNTIIVSYGGKTTTFSVTVTAYWTYQWDYSMGKIEDQDGWYANLQGTSTSTLVSDGQKLTAASGGGNQVYIRPAEGNPFRYATDNKGVLEIVAVQYLPSNSSTAFKAAIGPASGGGTGSGICISSVQNKLSYTSTGSTIVQTDSSIQNGTEYTYRLVLDGTVGYVYLNGELKVTNNNVAEVTAGGGQFNLGFQNVGSTSYYMLLKSVKLRSGGV